MFACCNACYQKYINEDRSIDVAALKKIYGESAEIVETPQGAKLQILENHDESRPSKENIERIMEGKEPISTLRQYTFCQCSCHVHGVHALICRQKAT